MGVKLSESVLTFDLSRPLAAIWYHVTFDKVKMRNCMENVTDRPTVTKEYEYKFGVSLSESVLTFDPSLPLVAILISRDFLKVKMRNCMQMVTDRPIVTKEYEYKIGVKLSESVLTFYPSPPSGHFGIT